MKYLLDTNVCVQYLRGKNALIQGRVSSKSVADLTTCAVVVGELYYGAFRASNPSSERLKVDRFLAPFACLPFDQATADLYASVRVDLESRGEMIGHYDVMIAAIALAHNLTLVTHNTGEFSRIAGLKLEDWETP